jgi:hypothetical protein
MTRTNALPYYTVALISVVKSFKYIPARQGILTEGRLSTVDLLIELALKKVNNIFHIKRS